MGGYGSGRRWNSKATTSHYHRLDVRRWQRDGLLVAHRSFVCQWWNVDVLPCPNLRDKPNRVTLFHLGSQER